MISKLVSWGKDRNEAIERMRRALYEYVIVGVKTNIAFHMAVMENPRYVAGDLETGFIDRETGLLEDIKRIVEQGDSLKEKLPQGFSEKKKIAAIAAVAAVAQMQRR
jgi:pyruvate carboxylase subunit A